MPRSTRNPVSRKHLVIIVIAAVIALSILLFRAPPANAMFEPDVIPPTSIESSQITGEDYQDAVTTERLMLLGMLGLVALTFLYLRWRPPRYDDDSDEARRLDE